MEIVCISDTHNRHRELTPEMLGTGDVLVHSGDFTNMGSLKEVRDFVDWFAGVPGFRHKILIAGNHDIGLDPEYVRPAGTLAPSTPQSQSQSQTNKTKARAKRRPPPQSIASSLPRLKTDQAKESTVSNPHSRLGYPKARDSISFEEHQAIWRLVAENPAFHYLHDSGTVIDGVRFYGAPYVVLGHGMTVRWGFSLTDAEITAMRIWERIPSNTDVLITHGPPFGIMDRSFIGNVGDDFLLLEVMERVHPRVHIFGHIHNQQGECTVGRTRFINAASQGEYDTPLLEPMRVRVSLDANDNDNGSANAKSQVGAEAEIEPGTAPRRSSPASVSEARNQNHQNRAQAQAPNRATIATCAVEHLTN